MDNCHFLIWIWTDVKKNPTRYSLYDVVGSLQGNNPPMGDCGPQLLRPATLCDLDALLGIFGSGYICSRYRTYGISNYRHTSTQDVILLILLATFQNVAFLQNKEEFLPGFFLPIP